MSKYIKYIILFIILVAIGAVGINLYGNTKLDSNSKKEEITNKKTSSESKEQEENQEESSKKENSTSDTSEKQETPTANKDNTIDNSTTNNSSSSSSNEKDQSSKGTTSSNELNDINHGTISGSTNPSDLTVSSNSSSSNNAETDSSTNFVIDVTTNNTITQSSTSTNEKSSTTSTNTVQPKITEEYITVEIDNNSALSSSNEQSTQNNTSSNQTTQNQSTTSSQDNSNQNTTNSQNTTSDSSTTENSNNSSATTPSTETSSYKTNVDFTKIDSCESTKVIKNIKSSGGKAVKVHYCIRDYILNNKKTTLQNFAITDQYVYFSYAGRGAWVTDSYVNQYGKTVALKKVSANYIVRINKANNTYQVGYVEYAGHSQSFDVAMNAGVDQIYLNYFARLYKGSLGNGSLYTGLTMIPFTSNNKATGIEIIPNTSIYINKEGTKLATLKSANYMENGKLKDSYYTKVRSIGANTNYMTNPELAIDEANNQIAIVSGTTAYIYKLNDFMNKKITLIKKFTIASSKQGIELYNGYLYYWAGAKDQNFTLRKYKISTGKLVDTLTLNLKSYYSGNGHEAEGISIHNGKIYLGIQGNNRTNDLLLVNGF